MKNLIASFIVLSLSVTAFAGPQEWAARAAQNDCKIVASNLIETIYESGLLGKTPISGNLVKNALEAKGYKLFVWTELPDTDKWSSVHLTLKSEHLDFQKVGDRRSVGFFERGGGLMGFKSAQVFAGNAKVILNLWDKTSSDIEWAREGSKTLAVKGESKTGGLMGRSNWSGAYTNPNEARAVVLELLAQIPACPSK